MFVLKVACLLITLKSCCILIKAATMIEKAKPLNTTSNENLTFIEGDIAFLPCPFKTMGYLKVIWLSPDMKLISFEDRRIINDVRVRVVRLDKDTWNLQINNISSKDTGYYRCMINTYPEQTKMIYLDVKSAPTEIKKIQPMNDTTIHNVTETEGDNAILPCSFKSSATGYVQVEWMNSDMTLITIENLRITDDERVSVRSPHKDVWNLHINDVRLKDTGYYRCSLINDPVKTEMVYLHVKERTKTSTTPATFTTPGFVQTTTIFRKRTPDKATRASVTMTAANMHPKLNTTTEHLTVVEGGTATLPCTVQSMGDQVVFESEYQVIWISPKKTMISMGDRRLMDDLRMSVERPYISVWNLLIRNIRHNDTGYYECRINTSPVQTNKVFLDVKVPPAIVSQMSSDTIVLAVGQTATLVCNVTGIPQPNVTWYKRNHKGTSNIKEKIGSEGEVLIIHNVSRNCDDIYECYVDNGVPPAVSKAIRVVVKYAPEVHLQHPKRLGQYSGKETVLDCLIQANPLSITGWLVNGQIITKSDKYDIEILNEVENRLNLALRIRDISPSEFGTYECFASNFLGEDKEEMFLFELTSTSTTTTTSSTAATDTTVSRKQPPHNNRPGDQKSAEHSRPNYNSIDRQDNPPNVTPANSKSIERTKTSTTPATFTTPAFVQTTTIFRERTPDKATRGHHAKTTVERPGRPILICQLGRTRSTLRRTRLKLCRTRPTLRRTTPTLPSNM